MDVSNQAERRPEYKSPKRVQVWFLFKSRCRLRRKYRRLKAEQKRLRNRVHEVTRSRQKWRQDAERLGQQAQRLEAENALLRDQLHRLKKR